MNVIQIQSVVGNAKNVSIVFDVIMITNIINEPIMYILCTRRKFFFKMSVRDLIEHLSSPMGGDALPLTIVTRDRSPSTMHFQLYVRLL